MEAAPGGGCLLTWWIISFKISTGRSSSFSGPFEAFALPFCAGAGSVKGGAPTAPGAGVLVHTSSGDGWEPISCASSCEGENERAKSASEGSGDAVVGVPGVESGESAMMW